MWVSVPMHRNERKPAEGTMWTVVVVAMPPVFSHSAKAVEGFEDIAQSRASARKVRLKRSM